MSLSPFTTTPPPPPPSSSSSPSEFITWINGKEHRLTRLNPELTLLQYLRQVGLTGTKLGCGEGGCGACTVVMAAHPSGPWQAINACLVPLASLYLKAVITVEGIGNTDGYNSYSKVHLVQKVMEGGSQCGFCTPGFVMSLYARWRNKDWNEEEEEAWLDGNLCRCTGYSPIMEAARKLCARGSECCRADPNTKKSQDTCQDKEKLPLTEQSISDPTKSAISPSSQYASPTGIQLQVGQELIFPPTLQARLLSPHSPEIPIFKGDLITWYHPRTLNQLLNLMEQLLSVLPPSTIKLVFGNTEVGILFRFNPLPNPPYSHLIYVGDVSELDYIKELSPNEKVASYGDDQSNSPSSFLNNDTWIEIGAGVSLTKLRRYCQERKQHSPPLACLYEMLRWFAGQQIRNVSSWAGNVVNASPISDLVPVLMAARAELVIRSQSRGIRRVPMQEFIKGYRHVDLQSGEIVQSVVLQQQKYPSPDDKKNLHDIKVMRCYKQSKRREDDISIVNACFWVNLEQQATSSNDSSWWIKDCELVYGGMGPTTRRSNTTRQYCLGKRWDYHEDEVSTLNRQGDRNFLAGILENLQQEFWLPADVVGGMAEYRLALVKSLFFKFYLAVSQAIGMNVGPRQSADLMNKSHPIAEWKEEKEEADTSEPNDHNELEDDPSYSNTSQHIAEAASFKDQPQQTMMPPMEQPNSPSSLASSTDPLKSTPLMGKAIPHLSGLRHATGQAKFLDDFSHKAGELYAGLVQSTVARGRIKSIDINSALQLPGVQAIVTSKDIPGCNKVGSGVIDDFVFVELSKTNDAGGEGSSGGGVITSCGQLIALVVAVDQRTAQRGAKMVRIEYEQDNKGEGEMMGSILTIDDAIAANSYFSHKRILQWNTSSLPPSTIPPWLDNFFSNESQQSLHPQHDDEDKEEEEEEDHAMVKGTVRIGGQDHFYLETQAALVIPHQEDDSWEIWSSTQNPSEGQRFTAIVLGIPFHRVRCRVSRLGGGFGGKETRSSYLIAALAVAAHRTGRPVRCMLDRDEDMRWTGGRHPFRCDYRTVWDRKSGKLLALDGQVYSNGGYSTDLSVGVLDRCLTHTDNVYWIPHGRLIGRICRTNLPSNTAFRGFGGPQGMFFMESIMWQASQVLKLDLDELRRVNFYQNGKMTPFRMSMANPPIAELYEYLIKQANYEQRLNKVNAFNERYRWRKRGLAMVPTKFGIAFGVGHLNQGGALVHILIDGSVLISHGGVEMGQGLHTKIAQIAVDTLGNGLCLKDIRIVETNTDIIANTSATAASVSSDLYGMAVQRACIDLKSRLEPFRKDLPPKASLSQVATAAYHHKVSLTAHGFYAIKEVSGFNWNQTHVDNGRLYHYFTYGVSCSEVEVDVLTGDHRVLRTDIVMDVGKSLNPAVDRGQIEGAFAQGLGLFTLEQPLYTTQGDLLTKGPSNYKIPTAGDAPKVLKIHLWKGNKSDNTQPVVVVGGSRAVGEPPLFLAASVFFAIQKAIKAARQDRFNSDKCQGEKILVMDSPATSERIRLAMGDNFLSQVNVMDEARGGSDKRRGWSIEAS